MQQPALIPRVIPLPAWLPAELRTRLSGQRVSLTLPRQVRSRLRTPERVKVSEWAAKHRVVTAIDAYPGPWRNEMVPHTVKIMDTTGLAHVREVWMCMPERAAKTQILINAAMASLDQGGRSGNIFWLMPTELDARQAMGERLIPSLRECKRTARLLSTSADDTSRGIIRFKHGVRLRPAWSNSPSSMASYFGRLNIADECDKFADRTSEGTDPITLFLKRSRDDRHGSRYLFASTPAGKYIYKGSMSCQQVWQFQARCPDCGEYVTMDGEHLVIPEGATPEEMHFHEVRYACNSCGVAWDERTRRLAYLAGRWYCIKGADLPRPETVGFHMSAFPLPTVPLAEIAAAKLKAEAGDLSEKCAYANGYLCIDYVAEQVGAIDIERVLKFKSDLPRDLVPPDTALLGLLIDTQQVGFYYEVWALGYAPEIAMHMLRHDQVETFADLEGLLAKTWKDADGKEFRISGGLIDSGGTRQGWQKHSRTSEVLEWCSTHRTVRPHKGMHGRNGDMIGYKNQDSFPGTGKKIPGGLIRVNIRVDLFKDELEHRLGKEPDNLGALSFHDGIDEHFAKHFTAESKDVAGDWIHNKKQRNDYWDCAGYALAFRHINKLRIPRRPSANPAPVVRKKTGFVKGWKI